MEFQNLGNSGLKISKVIMGFMGFGKKDWQGYCLDKDVPEDREKIFDMLQTAYDMGIRTWDTANTYSNGASEQILGEFLKERKINRSTVTILTKCWFYVHDDPSLEYNSMNQVNRKGLSRKHIMDAVAASVERLGTYIDVLQIHRYDDDTPTEETMKALHDVVEAGHARYIGASSMRAVEFAEMQHCADKHGWTKFVSMQNYHNLLYREEEREMIPYCKKNGVTCIPWSPVARGLLAKPNGAEKSVRHQTDGWLQPVEKQKEFMKMLGVKPLINNVIGEGDATTEIINRVEKVSKELGKTMAQVAIAWCIAKGDCPIVGANSIERVKQTAEAVQIKLTQEQIDYLEEPYQAQATSGHFES